MKVAMVSSVALSALLAASNPAFAQHESHQRPGMASPTANIGSCAQNAQTVTHAIDEVNARIEDARQLNDPARMRAAVGDIQLALTQMKVQLADCVALSKQSGGVGSMAGMDHSKMAGMEPAKPKPAPAAAAQPSKAAASTGTVVALRTQPAPPRSGDNEFEVTIKDAAGKPIADADVSLALYMPAMASLNMPAMRSVVTLTPVGNGAYKGSGTIGRAGDWDVTVTASRKGEPLAVKTMKLTTK